MSAVLYYDIGLVLHDIVLLIKFPLPPIGSYTIQTEGHIFLDNRVDISSSEASQKSDI